MKVKMVAIMAAMACMAGVAHANLLVNGGFETPGTGGANCWTGTYGVADWAAMSGSVGAYNGNSTAYASYNQERISVTAGETYEAGLYCSSLTSYTNASTTLAISWFDAGSVNLGSSASYSFSVGPSLTWTFFSVTGVAPASAVSATFSITANNAGTVGALAYDEASFIAIPEPASAMLLGLSSLGLIAWRRLRK